MLHKIVVIFSKFSFFFYKVHLIQDEIIGTYVHFVFAFTFFSGAATKFKHINREQRKISRSCENPKCVPINNQRICFVVEEQSSNSFLDPYSYWEIDLAAPLSFRYALDGDFMTLHYAQTSTHQHKADLVPVFYSLQQLESNVKVLSCNFEIF